jgi:hypothetical protein
MERYSDMGTPYMAVEAESLAPWCSSLTEHLHGPKEIINIVTGGAEMKDTSNSSMNFEKLRRSRIILRSGVR